MGLTHKSQSALEYMMTYGWAILIIVIVAVILYSMGIFNPSSSVTFTSSGFAPFIISSAVCNNFGLIASVESGAFPNNALYVNLDGFYIVSASGVNAQYNKLYNVTPAVHSIKLKPDSSVKIIIPGISCNTSKTFSISAKLQYYYSSPAGTAYSNATGTITGQVSSANFINFVREPPNSLYGDYHGGFILLDNNSHLFNKKKGFTIAIWFKEKTLDLSNQGCNDFGLVAKNGAGYDNESYLVDLGTSCTVSGDFAIRSFIVNSTNDEEVWTLGGNAVKPSYLYNKWFLYVFTYNASRENESIYLDGKFNISQRVSGTLYTSMAPLDIGARGVVYSGNTPEFGYRIFNGTLANMQFYNVSLNSSQIMQLYNEGIYGRPVNYNDLMGWWPLYGDALDYSGYGTDGIPINMSI
ncbi:MAG: LamG domain-containing protein [Candidatus Parvarchaeota archaeon]|nr:LamG domain-containing protein [Candidatus Parvarchaeota archaeon]MCW1295100.1 LamG domain-containing protein [Candidatus Parvarchaeum tengchongense]MCW1312321.1 LamG domain-containing protein [Candidatus Parvarchaeum tengchongense]